MSFITQFLPEIFRSGLCLKNYAEVTIRFPRLQFYVTQNIVMYSPLPPWKAMKFNFRIFMNVSIFVLRLANLLRSDSTHYLIEMKEQDFKIDHDLFLLYPIELFRSFT